MNNRYVNDLCDDFGDEQGTVTNNEMIFSSRSSVRRPRLLAPAGDWDCLHAAVENGADAIYFGLDQFNARMRATNFTQKDLPEVMSALHQRGVKGYVALNTLVFTRELPAAERYLAAIIEAGVDAVIVQDVGLCRLIRHLSPDFPIHASTQMTVTSAEGVMFAHQLGCEVVVLARECSIKELTKIQHQLRQTTLPVALEVFVHGALCVAYSGQCLTSESLGGRSANRGECAQACRMAYDLIVDGQLMNLGDRHYLLSPQDLAGLEVLPDLIAAGVACFKIEGRLKSPEYVASVTQVYRNAIDRILTEMEPRDIGDSTSNRSLPHSPAPLINTAGQSPSDGERYQLEMAFSRGLYSGWFKGINNQALVHGRYGKKRGVYLGTVVQVEHSSPVFQARSSRASSQKASKGKRHRVPQHRISQNSERTHGPRIIVQLEAPLKPGDGVMFDGGHPNGREEGGRVYTIDQQGNRAILSFGSNAINSRRIKPGDSLWKTSDPALEKEIRKSFSGDVPHYRRPIIITLKGKEGEQLEAIAQESAESPDSIVTSVRVRSTMPLVAAHTNPLTTERFHQQFSRLGNTPFSLASLVNYVEGEVMIPAKELNRLRRELVEQLLQERSLPKSWTLHSNHDLSDLLQFSPAHPPVSPPLPSVPILIPLLRNLSQLRAVLNLGIETVYCEFEDPRRYKDAVTLVREISNTTGIARTIWVAPPRITKPLENWMLEQVRRCHADGYLVRNYDQLSYFQQDRCIGDFSLNVANPITAHYFLQEYGLERLTASYDLNIQQLQDLLNTSPSEWFEVTLHQHMPMFHMEHCVFCAFLSEGTDFTNCGRPCETHQVKLRDRTGAEHPLHADAGCRNTVYNSRAQTGVEFLHRLIKVGLRHIRIEFLHESPQEVCQTISLYQQVLDGQLTGRELWQQLKLQNQLGVTRGQLELS